MTVVLEKELETYEAHRDELLGSSEGKFVLIHEGEVIGTYASELDAIAEGYRRFGNVPFLVKQIAKFETPLNFVSNLLGV